jgi:hypothetical protein
MQHGADDSLSEEERMANRAELLANVKMHTLDDAYYGVNPFTRAQEATHTSPT